MKHLVRAGGVLLVIMLVFFVLLRIIPAPAPLEAYGFYREKDNSTEWASAPMQYADPNLCGQCHAREGTAWASSTHATVSCENCHGPGQNHIDNGAPVTIDASREACAVCHARLPARPPDFPQVDLEEHGAQLECKTCHYPHDPVIGSKA